MIRSHETPSWVGIKVPQWTENKMEVILIQMFQTHARWRGMTMTKIFQVGRFRPFYRPRSSLGWAEVWLYSFYALVPRWGGRASPTSLPPLSTGKTRYPFYRRLGGPQGRSGRAENLVSTGIRSQTFQPVASHSTDSATRSTRRYFKPSKNKFSPNQHYCIWLWFMIVTSAAGTVLLNRRRLTNNSITVTFVFRVIKNRYNLRNFLVILVENFV